MKFNDLLREIDRLKQTAIADGTFEMPNPSTILRRVGGSNGYFQQQTTAAKKARNAYRQALLELAVAKQYPALVHEVDALRLVVTQQWQAIAELEAKNTALQKRVQAFERLEAKRRSLEAEYSQLRSVA